LVLRRGLQVDHDDVQNYELLNDGMLGGEIHKSFQIQSSPR
jgi:hypothetical protein